jgi:hypothetical protein
VFAMMCNSRRNYAHRRHAGLDPASRAYCNRQGFRVFVALRKGMTPRWKYLSKVRISTSQYSYPKGVKITKNGLDHHFGHYQTTNTVANTRISLFGRHHNQGRKSNRIQIAALLQPLEIIHILLEIFEIEQMSQKRCPGNHSPFFK